MGKPARYTCIFGKMSRIRIPEKAEKAVTLIAAALSYEAHKTYGKSVSCQQVKPMATLAKLAVFGGGPEFRSSAASPLHRRRAGCMGSEQLSPACRSASDKGKR